MTAVPPKTSAVTVIPALQCEDERFELDMLIEAGASTIRLLDMMAKDISELDEEVSVV